MDDPPMDDVERLLTHLTPVEPPADFLQRVLSQTRDVDAAERSIWTRWIFGAVYLISMVTLLLFAYGLGVAVSHNGTSTLVSQLASDATLFGDAPQSYLAAIVASLPWLQIAGVALDIALVAFVTQVLVRGAGGLRSNERAGA